MKRFQRTFPFAELIFICLFCVTTHRIETWFPLYPVTVTDYRVPEMQLVSLRDLRSIVLRTGTRPLGHSDSSVCEQGDNAADSVPCKQLLCCYFMVVQEGKPEGHTWRIFLLYCGKISSGAPSILLTPSSIKITRSHNSLSVAWLWETMITVLSDDIFSRMIGI